MKYADGLLARAQTIVYVLVFVFVFWAIVNVASVYSATLDLTDKKNAKFVKQLVVATAVINVLFFALLAYALYVTLSKSKRLFR